MKLVDTFSTIDDVLHNGSGGLLEGGACLTLEYEECYRAIMWGIKKGKYLPHSGEVGGTLGIPLLKMDSSLLMGGFYSDCDLGLENLNERMRTDVYSEGLCEGSFAVVAKRNYSGVIRTSLVYGDSDIFNRMAIVPPINKKTFGEGLGVLDSMSISDDFVCNVVLGKRLSSSDLEYSRKN